MTSMIPEFIQYFFSQLIYNMIMYTQIVFFLDDSNIQVEKKHQQPKLSKRSPPFKYRSMQEHEVKMVTGNLGIFCNSKGDNFPKSINSDDLFDMFEQEQPRLDEVKEAFDVFDENKDGYIDAKELKRVLSALGLTDHKVDMDDCKKMITVFDDNNDGRIDLMSFSNLWKAHSVELNFGK